MNNNIENRFNKVSSPVKGEGQDVKKPLFDRELSKADKKELAMTVDAVLGLISTAYDTKDDGYKMHQQMVKAEKEKKFIEDVAKQMFGKTNALPHPADLLAEVKKRMEAQKGKVA